MRVRRHRRYSTEFKLQLVEAYLAGDGSAKGLADEHGICHSLILIWAEKYRKGELTLDVQREEQMQEAALKVADLERKVGQHVVARRSGRLLYWYWKGVSQRGAFLIRSWPNLYDLLDLEGWPAEIDATAPGLYAS